MNFWEKLTFDPEGGGCKASPVVRVVVGLAFIGLDIEDVWTDDIKLGKQDSNEHLYLSQSPGMFFVACAVLALMAAWAFSSARLVSDAREVGCGL